MKNSFDENPGKASVTNNPDIVKNTDAVGFYNCHTHIFNFKHVHTDFLKGMIPWWFGAIMLIIGLFLVWVVCSKMLLFLIQGSFSIIFLLKLICTILLSFTSLIFLLVAAAIIFRMRIHNQLKRNRFKKITSILKKIIPGEFDFLVRYANFILHAYDTIKEDSKKQEAVFNELQSYYPKNTKFVVLSMDMDYMVNCNKGVENSTFYDQLDSLKKIKKNRDYANLIFPFIHADPRRIGHDTGFIGRMEDELKSGHFNGIKIYPALGYFPFDIRLKPMYDLALKYNLPITTHCSVGPVFYRGKRHTLRNEGYYNDKAFIHPFTGNKLYGKKPGQFTPHFTHPLNYYFLMNCPEKLHDYWKQCEANGMVSPTGNYSVEDLAKYRNLKICLGHYAGSKEWRRYLDNAWLPAERLDLENPGDIINVIHRKNGMWKYGKHKDKNLKPMNWFSIISEMLKLTDNEGNTYFPNLYTDISYNLSDRRMLPLLKVRLETDRQIRKKILFGTDFYMVAMKMTERRATINLRSFIGEDNFNQIAVKNPGVFLYTG